MTTLRRHLLPTLLVAALVAGCSTAASPSPSPGADATPGGGGSGGSGGGPGIDLPGLDDLFPKPPDGAPTLVFPKPGQLNVHPVGATLIEPAVQDRHLWVRVSWWSGVEPCSVLDSVAVDRDGDAFTITLFEGSSDLAVACIEIAMLKATVIDLGELEPGTYTLSAGGEAPRVTVAIG